MRTLFPLLADALSGSEAQGGHHCCQELPDPTHPELVCPWDLEVSSGHSQAEACPQRPLGVEVGTGGRSNLIRETQLREDTRCSPQVKENQFTLFLAAKKLS